MSRSDQVSGNHPSPAPCGGFVAGTLVHTKRGLVPIERIKVGDLVLSQPEKTGEFAYKQVVKTVMHEDQEVFLLEHFLSDELTARNLVVTGSSLFWVENAGWTSVDYLKPGDDFELHDKAKHRHRLCTVYKIRKILETEAADVGWTYDSELHGDKGPTIDLRDGLVKVSLMYEGDNYNTEARARGVSLMRLVFNIEVEDFHTYYVGEAGVWVHDTE